MNHGSFSTSCTLTTPTTQHRDIIAFVLLELAKNPTEQAKLRESLSRLPPENWTSSECLHRVVKEGMRLHPVGR